MKFNMYTVRALYYEDEVKKYEKYGFNFISCKRTKTKKIVEDCCNCPIYEINTLEELMELIKDCGTIIMSENFIKIYDDYNE